jgi:hypothetical protein
MFSLISERKLGDRRRFYGFWYLVVNSGKLVQVVLGNTIKLRGRFFRSKPTARFKLDAFMLQPQIQSTD